ncbi:hypothetical protein IIC65_06730 [Candidatus Sumerlaeota bacterium]|nr:hypothetical protein [Candidatus Sumerlaeota bacterium]
MPGMVPKLLFVLAVAAALGVGCATISDGPAYEGSATATIQPGVPFADGRLAAMREAQRKARDQILLQVAQLSFPNGESLERAMITDPFINAKVRDTVRTARIIQQSTDDGARTVSVTLRLDKQPLLDLVAQDRPGR